MWEAVRKSTGKHHDAEAIDGVNAESLNDQFAAISSDLSYTPPLSKVSTSARDTQNISEYSVFKHRDKLRHAATGLDGLPAWFLRVLQSSMQDHSTFHSPLPKYSAMKDGLHPSNPQNFSTQAAR